MLKNYVTVKGYGEKEIVIDKSRFIGYVQPAENEEDALAFIEQIKKKHWDATHNCSAYLIGEQDQFQKANDDGEPSGTAGKPMLEVLKKQGLKDVVVVVTRYFGGIKLGAGGLVRAYTQSTVQGLKAAQIIERSLHHLIHVTIDYTLLGRIENEVRGIDQWIIKHIDYLDKVTLQILVPDDLVESFKERMVDLTSDQCELAFTGEDYVDRIVE
ncbi:YigZ family protein [Bacillus horti]|uniref:YigZ family protein n=1 Tax=Caldalkalibacillus horti TaxID=77523 RepID=A0ABT9VZF2_9BACI|nr:YigZ family protein [Bacillus horti]MDQ0166366.1 putative YigZ family protein [Bacillus horti]